MRHTTYGGLIVLLLLLGLADIASAQRPFRRPPFGGGFRSADQLKEGDAAPDFTLKMMAGKETVTLSSFKDKRPVALIFGSYT